MLLLLIPGVLIDESGLVGFKIVIFNLLGPINVAMALIYFRNKSVSGEEFKSLLRLIALPLISVLSYVIIKTPDFETVEFNLGPNFETSGGWGTNQVSTALGLGAFLAFIFWRNSWRLSGYKWLDLVLIFLFVLRGLLTFSRGGMIGGAFGITLVLMYEAGMQYYSWRMKRLLINLVKIVPLVILFILLFQYADRITEGKLTLRYQGETPGTLAGSKAKTLNVFTSNRLNVFKDDLSLWKDHPILGVGVGASLYLRENTRRVSPHVELSRLLSEHGLFGLIFFLILSVLGYKVFRRAARVSSGPILLALFIIALFTTFHSAMRTFISPLLIGLSMLTISEFTRRRSCRLKSLLYIGNKISHHGFTPGVIETLGKQLEETGFGVYYAGTFKNKALRLLQMLYRTIVIGGRADYILIDTYSTSAFWFAFSTGCLANALKKKYIPILHGGDLPSRIKRSKHACDRLFKNAYINVAVSGYLQKAFEDSGYKTTTIPNSISVENYPFRHRPALKPKLLWVRAFSKIYNPMMTIDVLVELKKTYPDASLCMVGPDKDGTMVEFIEYATQKKLLDSIEITGKLPREEWIKLSEKYDILINTTNIDNTPISIIEAMALGLPVVTTNPGGIPFLLEAGKEAMLVDNGDFKSMATAIGYLIENPSAAIEMTRAAREKAEGFDWMKIQSRWIEVLNA